MTAFIIQICMDVVASTIIWVLLLLKSKPELLEKLGFKLTQADLPYDYEEGLMGEVLVVKTAPNKRGQIPTWVFPQTSEIEGGIAGATKANAEELGLPKRLYTSKGEVKVFGASRFSRKSYRLGFVKVKKRLILKAAQNGEIPWEYVEDKNGNYFIVDSVEYTHAKFISPIEALALLPDEAKKGRKPNPVRGKLYTKALYWLSEKHKFELI